GRRRRRPPPHRPARPRAPHPVLPRRQRARLRRRRLLRPRRLRSLVPDPPELRGLPAGLTVRGVVPIARAHGRRRRPYARGGTWRVRGDRRVSRALYEAIKQQGGTI